MHKLFLRRLQRFTLVNFASKLKKPLYCVQEVKTQVEFVSPLDRSFNKNCRLN